jgi:hypothetical protein
VKENVRFIFRKRKKNVKDAVAYPLVMKIEKLEREMFVDERIPFLK